MEEEALHYPGTEADTFKFLHHIAEKYDLRLGLKTYEDLYTWSTTHLDLFWSEVWDWTGVIGDKGSHVVDNSASPCQNPSWFSEAKLNWAENMLRNRSDKLAVVHASLC